MVHKILFVLIVCLGFLSLPSKAADPVGIHQLRPYYEQGMYLGVQTAPIEIVTEEGMPGEIEVGYTKLQKQEGLLLRVLPGSVLYNSLDTVMGPILNAKIAHVEAHPETGGIFSSGHSVSGVEKLNIDLNLEDGSRLYIYGSPYTPTGYNFVNVEFGEDIHYLPFLIMMVPKAAHNVNTGNDGKFSELEKYGVKNLRFTYGDKSYTFPLEFISKEYLQELKKAYKTKK